MKADSTTHLKRFNYFEQFLSICLFVGLLYVARDVLIPVALGVLFAFLLTPLVNRLQHAGLPNVIAVISSLALVFGLLGLLLVGLSFNVKSLIDELPEYRKEFREKIEKFHDVTNGLSSRWSSLASELSPPEDSDADQRISQDFSEEALYDQGRRENVATDATGALTSHRRMLGTRTDKQLVRDGSAPDRSLFVVEPTTNMIDWKTWAGSASIIFGPLGTAGLGAVIALFALIYREDLRDRFVASVSQGNYVVTADALSEASARIAKYLRAQATLNASYGVTFGIGLFAIGSFLSPTGNFPYAVALGALAGIVRFVPYVGPLVGAVIPIGFSALIFPGFGVTIAVLSLVICMELISNNVLEPLLYGSSTGVSPMAVIVMTIFWGWLWGPIGILLATPMTVCFVVLGKHVPRFRFLTTLLSDQMQVPASVRTYQRLLAGDQHKIDSFVNAELAHQSLADFLDDNLIPSIKLIEANRAMDRDASELYDQLENSLRLAGLIEPTDDSNAASSTTDDPGVLAKLLPIPDSDSVLQGDSDPSLPLLCIVPVVHRGEYLVSQVLAHGLKEQYRCSVIGQDDFLDRRLDDIVALQPQAILLCVIPPHGFMQTMYWSSSLREQGHKGVVIASCFGKIKRFDRLFSAFRRRGVNWVVTSAHQLLSRLTSLQKYTHTLEMRSKTRGKRSAAQPWL